MDEAKYTQLLEKYNDINNSFSKKLIYHVGVDAGFYSEVGAMMECMLYCYVNEIRFVLYADDANFTCGRGWNEFFEDFCETSHDRLNSLANIRYPVTDSVKYTILRHILKFKTRARYLTSDIFEKCIPRVYSQSIKVEWSIFNIKGTIFDEFGKLNQIALRYNTQTKKEICELINSIRLPEDYVSIQFRGGDKILEFTELNCVEDTLVKIDENDIRIENIFVFTDDYKYIKELKELRPFWNIYTLTNKDENGYDNSEFNRMKWEEKRKNMIKLFSMVEICIQSNLHLGNEQTCVNNYIKSVKPKENYFCIVEECNDVDPRSLEFLA